MIAVEQVFRLLEWRKAASSTETKPHPAAWATRCGGRGMPDEHPNESEIVSRSPFRMSQDHAGGEKRRRCAAGGGSTASGSDKAKLREAEVVC